MRLATASRIESSTGIYAAGRSQVVWVWSGSFTEDLFSIWTWRGFAECTKASSMQMILFNVWEGSEEAALHWPGVGPGPVDSAGHTTDALNTCTDWSRCRPGPCWSLSARKTGSQTCCQTDGPISCRSYWSHPRLRLHAQNYPTFTLNLKKTRFRLKWIFQRFLLGRFSWISYKMKQKNTSILSNFIHF